MNEQNNKFQYVYSASMQEEIAHIRSKYLSDSVKQAPDKMEQLRQLDASVTKTASILSLCVGILSILIMGTGMSLIMTDFGAAIGIHSSFIIGILIGVIGMIGVLCAYPLYSFLVRQKRKKIAPQVLKLTEELMQP